MTLSHVGRYPTELEVQDIIEFRGINGTGLLCRENTSNRGIRWGMVNRLKYDFCDLLIPQKSFNRKISSYGLKHIAEHYIGEYVANGELIAAMIASYHRYRPNNGVNAEFSIAHKSVRALALEATIRNGYNAETICHVGDDYYGNIAKAADLATEEERRARLEQLTKRRR